MLAVPLAGWVNTLHTLPPSALGVSLLQMLITMGVFFCVVALSSNATGLSLMSTMKLQVAVLPAASVTVHTTVVFPLGNTYPFSVEVPVKLFVTVMGPQLSLALRLSNSVPDVA